MDVLYIYYFTLNFGFFSVNNNGIRKVSQDNGSGQVMVTGTRHKHGSANGYKMERSFSIPADAVNLKRRVGLFSGVALISGVMIGEPIILVQ